MAFVFCLSHSSALLLVNNGQALFVYLILLTELNDVFQFIFGKLFGKTKIVPRISPNKTLAGLLGGVFCTVLMAISFRFLTNFSLIFSILSGLLISLSGFIGDIILSALKRDVGVKDSSNLIPGHGGILDRIDSLVYTAPLFFHFVNYFAGKLYK